MHEACQSFFLVKRQMHNASRGELYFPPVTVKTSRIILFDTGYPSSVSELDMEN
jgi:hypothetical protein